MGVSLAAVGDNKQAQSAFIKAQRLGGLDTNLRNYVDAKLNEEN